MDINDLSYDVIGAAIDVQRELGVGLLEQAYSYCLEAALKDKGLHVEREVTCPIRFRNLVIDHGYRIDLLIENQLILELKTVEAFTNTHISQILTYLKLSQKALGLLINFHCSPLKKGIKRVLSPDHPNSISTKIHRKKIFEGISL